MKILREGYWGDNLGLRITPAQERIIDAWTYHSPDSQIFRKDNMLFLMKEDGEVLSTQIPKGENIPIRSTFIHEMKLDLAWWVEKEGYEPPVKINVEKERKIIFGESMKKLKERNWSCRLQSGKQLRQAIEDEDYQEILNGIKACYHEMLDNGIIDEDDCEYWCRDIDEINMEDEDIEDIINYELNNLYDACDNLGCWIELNESLDESLNSWNDVYEKVFSKIIDAYFPDEDEIATEVERVYSLHKGEDIWDEAYRHWHENDDEVNESLNEEAEWRNYQDRCADCIALVEEDGEWFCDEAGEFCRDVEVCPEGLGILVESLKEDLSDKEIFDILGIEEVNRKKSKYLLGQFRELARKYDPESIWLQSDTPYTSGKKIIDKSEDLMVCESLTEDLENLEITDTTAVVSQPTGVAKEESKTLWDRFMEATKEPEDAPLFGAKDQPVPDEVEEPKITLEESLFTNLYTDLEQEVADLLDENDFDVESPEVQNYIQAAAEYIEMAREADEYYSVLDWWQDTMENYPEELAELPGKYDNYFKEGLTEAWQDNFISMLKAANKKGASINAKSQIIDNLYSQHVGDADWDRAYQFWLTKADEVDESLNK